MIRTRGNNGNGKPAPPPKEKEPWGDHNAFRALRLYRERKLDLRLADHRAIHDWQLALVEDLGGQKGPIQGTSYIVFVKRKSKKNIIL
jgi:hypothetical protein